MPKIREYAPSTPSLSPSDRSLQAWETAGRRVGPLYNQAAQDIRQGGQVQGAMERDKIWPFDIYALEAANAKQTRNTSSNDTTTRTNPGSVNLNGPVREDNAGIAGADGTTGHADLANNLADEGYTTTPQSYANAQIAAEDNPDNYWGRAHGEASAGAVGVSRLARASASGAVPGFNPNSNLPVDWKTNPDYNGQNTVDTPNGQFTPNQLSRMSEKYMDTWNTNMAKWNRQQDAYWNGPRGWNTRRDQWLGGMDQDYAKEYDQDQKIQANIVERGMKQNPNLSVDDARAAAYRARHVFSTSSDDGNYGGGGSYDDTGPATPGSTGSGTGIVQSIGRAFGAMFGSDEPVATADIP